MLDVFGWLRRKAKDAVLGGIADAVEHVAAGDGPADLDRLRALLAAPEAKVLPAAPAADVEEPAGRASRRK